MPGYCEPWPGNMKTTGDAATTSDLPSCSGVGEDGRGPAAIVAVDGDGAAIAEGAPPDVQRERHVGEVLLLVSAEVLAESPRRGVERRLALGREREEHRAPAVGGGLLRRRLLDDGMRVRATDTERAHRGPAR